MRIISWNVNSIRARLPRVTALLAGYRPDLACLQEIKTSTGEFPAADFAAAGYRAAVYGEGGRNGVAVLSRTELTDVARGFAGDLVPEQARVLSVTAGGMRVVTVYVVNGRRVGAPEYELKLRWLDALTSWLRGTYRAASPLLVVGDFNVAPDDRDERRPTAGEGKPSDHAPLIITLTGDGR
jgi:exodeoxyribonuclease III